VPARESISSRTRERIPSAPISRSADAAVPSPNRDMTATSAAQLAWLRAVIADLRSGRLAWSEQELLATALGDAQAAHDG
jgi:hypothetical protein